MLRALFAVIAAFIIGSILLTYSFGVGAVRMRDDAGTRSRFIADVQEARATRPAP